MRVRDRRGDSNVHALIHGLFLRTFPLHRENQPSVSSTKTLPPGFLCYNARCMFNYFAASIYASQRRNFVLVTREYPRYSMFCRPYRVLQTGIAATELPLRVHLGFTLAGPLCAAI
jgi:hypothetical protein